MLGWFSPEVRAAMACHGALSEAGWELQDGLERAYHVLFGTAEKKKKNPTALLVIMSFHHTMGLTMVVPMNLFFPSLYWYHEAIFLLQSAAFFTLLLQQCAFTLDVGTKGGFRKMQLSVVTVFSLMVYSRALRYGFVVYNIVAFLYAEGGTVMFVGSCVATLLMSLLNALFVFDVAGKLVKFLTMSIRKDAQPAVLRAASSELLVATTGIHGMRQLTRARHDWAKLRGAFALGVLKPQRAQGKSGSLLGSSASEALTKKED
mmetsp:Transcript_168183/g.535197  ORF Transcript_168183/g.535197 Transcript_168183/m.535197 type:complete len:261 (+) Transcript_168183:334-1116(+)